MQSTSIAHQDLDASRASLSRLTSRYASQFDDYMPPKMLSASETSLTFLSEECSSPDYCPQTPTLSAPDTPTTAGPTSPGPLTPSTPFFGTSSPGYVHTKEEITLDLPIAPKSLLSQGVARFAPQRGGVPADLHGVSEVDEGQEIVIPEPRAGLVSPLRLHLSPPRPLATSTSRLKVQTSYTSLGSASTAGNLHQYNPEFHEADAANAYKSNVLSPSTTAVDDSFDTGMFEMVTPKQENGAFIPVNSALTEAIPSGLFPFTTNNSSQHVSTPANGSPPMSAASDNPSSSSSRRPLIFRRHRPPPMSVSQDLNSIVRRFHALQIFLRPREGPTNNGTSPETAFVTPPRKNAPGDAGRRDRVAFEENARNNGESMSQSRSANFPSTPTESWFPSPGPGSPVRFVADSPVPLTPSPPPTGGFIRRHRPRSVRSISPIDLGESALSRQGRLNSPDSGIEGLHDDPERASELLFPLPPSRGHRRQLAVSVSFQAFQDSVVSFGAVRESRSLSPHARRHIEGPQAEYRRRERLPDWATRPDIVISELGSTSDGGALSGGEAELSAKRTKGFWKTLSTSASGLFTRKEKTPSKQAADFEVPAPKKRMLASISGLFRRHGGPVTKPTTPVMHQATHREVWPPVHRRTSSCSDSTCLFHPQHPTPSLVAMSFASMPATGVGYDLGDTEENFLPDLGTWGLDASPPEPCASGFYTSSSGSANPSVGGTSSSIRDEGERVLQGIMSISASEKAKIPGSS